MAVVIALDLKKITLFKKGIKRQGEEKTKDEFSTIEVADGDDKMVVSQLKLAINSQLRLGLQAPIESLLLRHSGHKLGNDIVIGSKNPVQYEVLIVKIPLKDCILADQFAMHTQSDLWDYAYSQELNPGKSAGKALLVKMLMDKKGVKQQDEKDQQIQDLQEELNLKTTQIMMLERENMAQHNRIVELEEIVQEKQAEIDELKWAAEVQEDTESKALTNTEQATYQ
jgi:hypothetical protein